MSIQLVVFYVAVSTRKARSMAKISLHDFVRGMLKLEEEQGSTLLGIGPISTNLLIAAFELAKEKDFPLMLIASRNQVDSDELGGGYVNGWDQKRFSDDIRAIAKQVGYEGDYYLCRDHGGPWQRDNERNAHLPEEEAMELARKSYLEDMLNGFELLMIDPTKDPFEIGKVIPLDTVIRRTVDLIEWCEKERIAHNLPAISYEVGTEETNGGLTSTEKYKEFIERLQDELGKKNLPMPTFIVGQTGTLTRMTQQAGEFNYKNARELADMAASYGVGLKEHNGDYLDDVTLLEHIPAHVTATNVAPQYGTQETRAYIELCDLEKKLFEQGVIPTTSKLKDVLLMHAIKTERWRKWMIGDETRLSVNAILSDEKLSLKILNIAGHYCFNDDEVKHERERLYANLKTVGIEPERFVIEYLKRPLRQYIDCFNLEGLTTRVRNIL